MAIETLTPSLEDYLEAVLIAGIDRSVVRVKDISAALNVRAASVIGAMKSLQDKALISHERYGYIELTRKGRRKAKEIYHRHKILVKFLEDILGIDCKTAERDACKMEHYIGRKSLNRIVRFTQYIEMSPEEGSHWLPGFREFLKAKKRPEAPTKKSKKG